MKFREKFDKLTVQILSIILPRKCCIDYDVRNPRVSLAKVEMQQGNKSRDSGFSHLMGCDFNNEIIWEQQSIALKSAFLELLLLSKHPPFFS